MDPVHVGGDHDQAQEAVERGRQDDVAVIEDRGRAEQYLEQDHGQGRRAERADHGDLDDHRQQDLERVEADPGGQIEVEVGVMHHVQPPQSGDRVKQDVLPVDGEIEHDHRQHDLDPERPRQRIEEPPAERPGRRRDAGRRGREHEAQDDGIEDDDPDVAHPPDRLRHLKGTARRDEFPQRDEKENAQKHAQSNMRLEIDDEIPHRSDPPTSSALSDAGGGYCRNRNRATDRRAVRTAVRRRRAAPQKTMRD